MPRTVTSGSMQHADAVADDARKWLILASLSMTAVLFVFFLIAPAVGFPLTFPQARGLLEIILPVFLGYLGSASHFIFSQGSGRSGRGADLPREMVTLLIRGPVVVFAAISVCAIGVFGYSNRIEAPVGSGMSLDTLASFLSAALGLLAVTTSVASAYLFANREPKGKGRAKDI